MTGAVDPTRYLVPYGHCPRLEGPAAPMFLSQTAFLAVGPLPRSGRAVPAA